MGSMRTARQHTATSRRGRPRWRHSLKGLAAGGSNQHPLPSLNGKTARSWRGIVSFTHLAREGRMTVIIGRRKLLAALGGAAVAWPITARQATKLPRIGILSPGSFLQGLHELVEDQTVGFGWATVRRLLSLRRPGGTGDFQMCGGVVQRDHLQAGGGARQRSKNGCLDSFGGILNLNT